MPRHEPTNTRIVWPNGAVAHTFSADTPDSIRGVNADAAWCDEPAKWRYPEAWTQLMLGLRIGSNPQACGTTTPRPTPLIKQLVADAHCAVTRGTTYENRDNLAGAFFDEIVKQYEGTRLGRQELLAEILDDAPGALWNRDRIDSDRVVRSPQLVRVVVAVDPNASSDSPESAAGVVGVGLGDDEHLYTLEDASVEKPTPEQWATAAVTLFHKLQADSIVAEVNQGGDMVESVIRQVDPNVPVRKVRATRGKAVRAEPVAMRSEQGRAHHVGSFAKLEDELCQWEPGVSKWSPNRLDAYVWGCTDLMGLGGVVVNEGSVTFHAAQQPAV